MGIPELWGVVRRIDNLAGLDAKYEKAILSLRADLDDLRTRMTRLEAREDIVIAEAKAVTTMAAFGTMADIARRVGVLEALAGQPSSLRLPPS